MRILLVEDNSDHRDLMRRALTGHDSTWEVKAVESGEEVFRLLLGGEVFDLVFLDYSLPGRDGLEVLGEIRRCEAPPPVVLVTGRGDERVAVEAMKAGAYDYVVKGEGYLQRLPVVGQHALEALQLTVERLQVEKVLRENEERLRTIVEASLDAIIAVNSEGQLVLFNGAAQELFQYSEEEALNQPANILLREEIGKIHQERLERFLKKGVGRCGHIGRRVERLFRRKDGSLFEAEVSMSGGRLNGLRLVVLAIHDITERKQTEKALQESEIKYRNIFNDAILGIYQTTPEGRILSANPALVKMYGYDTPEEVINNVTATQMYVNPEDREIFKGILSKEGVVEKFEVPFRKTPTSESGEIFWVSINAHVVKDGQGNITHYEGTIEDITARLSAEQAGKRAEEALRESEERYRSLFENNHAVMLLIDPDNAAIMDANPAACTYYGWSREELMKRRIDEINTLRSEEVAAEMQLARSEKRNQFFFKHRRADDTIRDVEVYSGPILLKGKTLLYSIVHDITSRKRAEKNLKEREKTLQAFFDAVHESMVLIDTKGTVLLSNVVGAQRLGKTVPELVGTYLYDWFPPDVARYRKEQYEKVVDTGEPVYFQDTRLGRFFEQHCYPVFDEERNVSGVTIFAREITERKRSEEALRESEENFRRSLDDSPLGVRIVTMEGETLYANQAILGIYGYDSIEELRTTPVKKRYTPESYAEFQIRMEKRRQGDHDPSEYEVNIVRKNGEVRHLLVFRKEVLWNGERQFQTVYQDITDRRQAEIALMESENKFKGLVEGSIAGVHIIQDGVFKYVNQRFAEIHGYTVEEMVDKLGPKETILPDDLPIVEENIRKRLSGEADVVHYAFRVVRKDKKVVHIEIYGSHMMYQGKQAVMGTLIDITERKRVETALKESENRYRAIFENTGTATIIIEEDTTISLVNTEAERLTDYKKEEIEGKKSWTEFIVKEDLERMIASHKFRRINPDAALKNYEFKLIDRYGNQKDILLTIDMIPGTKRSVASLIDITARKLAEDNLKSSLLEKEVLLKEIHHRVKNNLTVISSIMSLQSRYMKDDTSREIFRECENRVRTMAMIHTKLYQSKDFAHIEFGFYIKELAHDLFYSYGVDPDAITLTIDVADIPIDINTAIPLGLLLNELLSNAIKYAFPEGRKGEIIVTLHAKDGNIILTIADDGIGFPETIDFRDTQSLGLQLVIALTQQLDATIELMRDKGTIFTITFWKGRG
jgi:PAS domain S-box-containing protein